MHQEAEERPIWNCDPLEESLAGPRDLRDRLGVFVDLGNDLGGAAACDFRAPTFGSQGQ